MSSTNNQFSSQNTDSDQQFNNDRLPGNTATSNIAPPSGTHAQQHNLHSLDTPLNQGGTNMGGGAHNLEQEVRKLQTDLEHSHPHTGTQPGNMDRPGQFSQNQGLNKPGGPFSSQPAAHNTSGREIHTGLGTGVSGLGGGAGTEPYATTSVGGAGAGNTATNTDYPTTLPGTGMSIGGQQHQHHGGQLQDSNRGQSDLPVPGAVVDHSRDNRDRLDHSKMAQSDVDRDRQARKHDEFENPTAGFNTSGTTGGHTGMHGTGTHGATDTGFNTSSHDPTSGTGTGTHGTAGLGRESHGQHHTGPLEVMGVTSATGRGDTTGHGTTGTGTGATTRDTGFDSSNRHQTGATGLKSTEGRKDGDLLAQDTRATNTGHAAHKPTSEPTGHTKPGLGDKIAGMAEKVQGKITGNPALVAKGEQREQGFGPKN